jgi:phosphoribosylanthranilate isomerase
MFRVKICGVTNVEDATTALAAGADAIGLNFYKRSPRAVSEAVARAISDAAFKIWYELAEGNSPRAGLQYPVGVFVNHDPVEVCRIVREVRLVMAQLHGDERPEYFADLPEVCTVRVSRLSSQSWGSIAEDLALCRDAASRATGLRFISPAAVLIDAALPGQYGGTGATLPWEALADHKRWLGDTPLILAGGLTPDNVAEAIRIVRPAAVDVASGVEASPGKKDPVKVRDFVANALGAFEALGAT